MSGKCNGCETIPKCEEFSVGCDKPVDASCVEYGTNPSKLNCFVPIPSGTKLDRILEIWEQKLCETVGVPILACAKGILGIPPQTIDLTPAALLGYIQQWICNYKDEKVKVTSGDSTSGYLFDKVVTGECLLKTVVKDPTSGREELKISIDIACLSTKLPQCFEIKVPECIIVDNSELPCNPQPTTPVISRSGIKLTGTNCNGSLQWYNSNNVLIGTGTTIEVDANATYYAKCTTSCGTSPASPNVVVPNIVTYKATRKALFTKDCGVNPCDMPCVGTIIEYSKTYISTISQDDADSKAENDSTFALEGQAKVNSEGTCTCPDCNCVFPVYNPEVVVTNATCSGQVINANGQILIVGINNADKMGFSYGSGGYTGVNYQDAITLNNYNAGNIETTPTSIKIKGLSSEVRAVIRIFNQSSNCFKDVVVTLTPPDCTQEQVVIIGSSVSCAIEDTPCLSYNIVAGNSQAIYWYKDCTTGIYGSSPLNANTSVQRCSKLAPQVIGGAATLIGPCA